jgi:hypothetical protein
MKFKKLIIGLGLSFSLLSATQLNIDMSDTFINSASKAWQIKFDNGKTYYAMLPLDIDFSQIQSILSDNQKVWIYRWYQKSSLVEADFGVKVLGVVKITNASVVYYMNYNGKWQHFDDFESFTNAMYKIADENIRDADKKRIFENSYVAGFDKILKNKLYLVKPVGIDLDLNLNISKMINNMQPAGNIPGMSNNEQSGMGINGNNGGNNQANENNNEQSGTAVNENNEENNQTSENNNEQSGTAINNGENNQTLETPPMPPQINDTNDNQSDNSVIQTPPMPPKIDE